MVIIIFKKREHFTNFITSVFRLKSFTKMKTDLHFENKRAHKSYSGLIRKKSHLYIFWRNFKGKGENSALFHRDRASTLKRKNNFNIGLLICNTDDRHQ